MEEANVLTEKAAQEHRNGSHCFRPYERLRSSTAFQRVKEEGKRRSTAHFGVNFAPNGLPYHRLGLVVQKRFLNSVQRNRLKRRLREWFRLYKDELPLPGKDIVIIARPGADRLTFIDLIRELLAVFTKWNVCGS